MTEIVVPYFEIELFRHRDECRKCVSSLLHNVGKASGCILHFVHSGELDKDLESFVREECGRESVVPVFMRCDDRPMRCMSVFETLIWKGITACVSEYVLVCCPWWICTEPIDFEADTKYMAEHPQTEVVMYAGCKSKGDYGVEEFDGYFNCYTNERHSPYIYDPTSPHVMRRADFLSGGRHSMDMTGRYYPCPSYSMCKASRDGRDPKGTVLCHQRWKFRDSVGIYRKYWEPPTEEITYRVVVPYYNVYRYVEECLRSIKDQTIIDRLRIVVCDDCSTPAESDGLDRIIEKVGFDPDHFVLVRHDRNKGLAEARNSCLAYFTDCTYTLCLDSDDAYCRNDALEILDARIKRDKMPDVVAFAWKTNYGKVKEFPPENAPFNKMLPDQKLVPVCAWCKAVKTKLFPRFSPDQVIFEDMDWSYRLYNSIDTMSLIQEPLIMYRISDVSVQRSSVYDNHYRLSMYINGIMKVYRMLLSWEINKPEVRKSAFYFVYKDIFYNLNKFGKMKI